MRRMNEKELHPFILKSERQKLQANQIARQRFLSPQANLEKFKHFPTVTNGPLFVSKAQQSFITNNSA